MFCADILQSDMVFFEVPGGGSVFSTGSITFCGSLPWNKFDNNVSKLLENIINKYCRRLDNLITTFGLPWLTYFFF